MPDVIIGLVGSLRRESFNRKLMQACVGMLDARFELRVEGIDGIPLYDGDLEASSGVPGTAMFVPRRAFSYSAPPGCAF